MSIHDIAKPFPFGITCSMRVITLKKQRMRSIEEKSVFNPRFFVKKWKKMCSCWYFNAKYYVFCGVFSFFSLDNRQISFEMCDASVSQNLIRCHQSKCIGLKLQFMITKFSRQTPFNRWMTASSRRCCWICDTFDVNGKESSRCSASKHTHANHLTHTWLTSKFSVSLDIDTVCITFIFNRFFNSKFTFDFEK